MKTYTYSLLLSFAVAVVIPARAQTTQNASQGTDITAEQFINQAALNGMKEVATGKIAKRKAQIQQLKSFGSMMEKDHGKSNTELMAIAKSKNIKLPKQSDIMPQTGNMNTGTSGTGNNTSGTTDNNNTTNTTGTGNTTSSTTNSSTNISSSAATGLTAGTDSLKMVTPMEVSTAIQSLDAVDGAQFDTAYTQMMIADHKNAIALFQRGAKSSDPDIKAFATKHLPTLQSHLQHVQSLSGSNSNGQQSNQAPGGSQ